MIIKNLYVLNSNCEDNVSISNSIIEFNNKYIIKTVNVFNLKKLNTNKVRHIINSDKTGYRTRIIILKNNYHISVDLDNSIAFCEYINHLYKEFKE